MEVLHTVLLGPYKYLLKAVMGSLSGEEKRELVARLASFNFSGMESRITGNIHYHYKFFVGRDYIQGTSTNWSVCTWPLPFTREESSAAGSVQG